ncbi:transposase [Thermus thalpophilus]|uniref:transposase n=1 Tax=Thermus thalpophilus TaxID=2908147 RepID=UPI001FA9FE00
MKKLKVIPPQVKFQAALEAVKGEKSLVEIARAYGVHPNTVVKWKSELMEKGPSLFAGDTQERELEKKVRQLEQLIGKKEVEIALLKKPNLRFA